MKRMSFIRSRWFSIVVTYYRLGLSNILSVLVYRLGIKYGVSAVTRLSPPLVEDTPIFKKCLVCRRDVNMYTELAWEDGHWCFGKKISTNKTIPDWHTNILNGVKSNQNDVSWWELNEFDSILGDVKGVWEPSRFDWVVSFALLAATKDQEKVHQLELWVRDWISNNPPYLGLNWKCGQEVSIRVLHLAIANQLLSGTSITRSMQSVLLVHLLRISPTISYAKAQDNNHGTSEAAALFIGGLLLEKAAAGESSSFVKQGRLLLEDRVCRLIVSDGSFSQHSLNYHRLMLDTLSLCELWRKRFSQAPFSSVFYQKARVATLWLHEFIDPLTGDAPVLGANDGAELLVLHGADYRDHRPSLHLAANLFLSRSAYPKLPGAVVLERSFELELYTTRLRDPVRSKAFIDGGFSVLRNSQMKVVFNYPRYRFRPIQSDALHLDLWVNGKNILRDGGTYSYNANQDLVDYFSGTASHNTVQFDDHDQMRKISRFLFTDWLASENVISLRNATADGAGASAEYEDYCGNRHKRTVDLSRNLLKITDVITGSFEKAVLRWRLIDADWVINDGLLESELMTLEVRSDGEKCEFDLCKGLESRYYGRIDELTVFECVVNHACTLTTRIVLK